MPAAFCGIAGFKPSLARVDRGGVVALAPSMDSVGPLAAHGGRPDRARRRAAGRVAGRRRSAAAAADDSATDASAAVGGLRFVVAEGEPVDDLDPGVAASFAAAVDALAAAGAHVERRPVAALAEAAALLREHGDARRARGLARARGAARRPRRRRGSTAASCAACATAARCRPRATPRSSRARPRLQATFAEELGGALLLTPTAPHVAPPIAPLEADDDVFLAANARTLRITMPASYLDAPGVALPIGPAEAGLPASLLVSGPSARDDRVLAGALAAEAALRAAARAR